MKHSKTNKMLAFAMTIVTITSLSGSSVFALDNGKSFADFENDTVFEISASGTYSFDSLNTKQQSAYKKMKAACDSFISCDVDLSTDYFQTVTLDSTLTYDEASETYSTLRNINTQYFFLNENVDFYGSSDAISKIAMKVKPEYRKASSRINVEQPIPAFVERLYTKVLGRASEEGGKADWVSKLNSGVSATDVSVGFIFSEEFTNRNLSNKEIITIMYNTFFDRDPDEAGFNDWVKKLNDGCSMELIFHGFTQSVEFNNLCIKYGIERGSYETTQSRDKAPNLTAFVSRMYTKALGRQYEVGGLNDWTGRYINGEITLDEMAYGFIFSEEFTNKDLSNEQYVDTLYATFFDRAPDEAGKADWLGQLNSGSATREQVLNGFLGAEEFENLVKSFDL